MPNELELLFENEHTDLLPWLIGQIPKHYKRLSVSNKEAMRLAKLGAQKMAAYYNITLFYSQAMIAGAIFDPKYDEIVVVTPSQYGKSWLLGHVANARAYEGAEQYIAATTANLTQMIMAHVAHSTQEAADEVKAVLLNKKDELDRLATSISKTRVAYKTGGFVESITLGDTYQDNLGTNKALGRAGDYIVDEAALVSEKAFIEMGRREFANIDGSKYKMIMLSNPHNPGIFYDKLTDPNPPKSRFILWMDSLTAVEEGRFSKQTVFESDFAKNKSTLRRYLLCVLDQDGGGMFDVPKVHKEPIENDYTQYFLGIDAAYKGKDNISIALVAVDEQGMRVEEVIDLEKRNWIDGVTSKDIIREITRIDRKFHVANVCVDVGYGVWLVEGLVQNRVNAIGVNFASRPTKEREKARHYAATNAENKRAEMHLDLQNLIEDGTISFSEQAYSQVKAALPYITSERKSTGKIKICPKESIKALIGKSPDELDAVLLGIHAAITFFGDSAVPIT